VSLTIVRRVNRIAKVIKLFLKKERDFCIVPQAAGSTVKHNIKITITRANTSNIYKIVRNKFITPIFVLVKSGAVLKEHAFRVVVSRYRFMV